MRETRPKRRWRETGKLQHGVLTRRQLLIDLSPAAIGRLIDSGELEILHRGIYLIAGHPLSWHARVMAATLLGGGHASHRAAAKLWDLGFTTAPLEVTTSRRPRESSVTWHRTELRPIETTTRDGIPVTSIHRTLIDLGDVVGDEVVEDALDRALERRLTSTEWLRKHIDDLGTRGRKGAAMLDRMLERGHEQASWLERRLIHRLSKSRLPPWFREYQVDNYFIDFAWPDVQLGVEVHGAKWRRRRKRWSKDLARHNELTARGWTVLHFTWEEIRDRPERVIAEIWATYERLSLRLGLSSR